MKRKKSVKKSTTLYIAPAQRCALQRLAARLDTSMGRLLREGADLVLARYNTNQGEKR